jgi:hypothetical protein
MHTSDARVRERASVVVAKRFALEF